MRTSQEIYKSHEWWKKVSLSIGIFKRLVHTEINQNLSDNYIRITIDELQFVQSEIRGMRVPGEVAVMHTYLVDAIHCLQMAYEEKLQCCDTGCLELLQQARLNTGKLQSQLLYNGIIETFLPNSKFTSKPGYFAHVMSQQDGITPEQSMKASISLFTAHIGFRIVALALFIMTCIWICQSIMPTGDLF